MRRTRLTCPITGTSVRIDTLSFSGEPAILDPDESPHEDLPLGWGSFVLRLEVRHPEFDQALRIRHQVQVGLEQEVERQIATAVGQGHRVSDHDRALAHEQIQRDLDARVPVPDEQVTVEYRMDDLSPNAARAIVHALASIGITLAGPGIDPRTAEAVAAPQGTPSTGAPLPVVEPGQAPRSGTPATGIVLPVVDPGHPVPVPTPTPATGAALPIIEPGTAPTPPAAPVETPKA